MNTEGFNDADVYDSIVPTGTALEPEISTIHQNGMGEETRYTSMPTCQPGMTPLQPVNMVPPPPLLFKISSSTTVSHCSATAAGRFPHSRPPYPADPDHPGGPDVPKQSFVGPMVLSCIAFWFCGVCSVSSLGLWQVMFSNIQMFSVFHAFIDFIYRDVFPFYSFKFAFYNSRNYL